MVKLVSYEIMIANIFGELLNPTLLKYLAFFLSYFFGVFIFWRAAKRELVDSQLIFDVVVLANVFALLIGRLADFILRPEYYSYSIRKLVFFNVYPGLDFIGSFLGVLLAVFVYSKLKRGNFWYIFDFLAFGIAFSLVVFYSIRFFIERFISKSAYDAFLSGLFGFSFLLIFWVLKRLEKKKRQKGFFAYFFLTCFFLVILASLIIARYSFLYKQFLLLGIGGLFLLTLISWYLSTKRKPKVDIREIFAFIVLIVMKTKRVLTNVREADSLAKEIILGPLRISKMIYILVKYLVREFTGTFIDLGRALGIKK